MIKQSLAAAAIALFCSFPAMAEEAKLQRTLSLTGHGETRAVPNLAIVSLGVVKNAMSAQEALNANTMAMTDLITALKSAGIADKDIQTSNFSVSPRYDYRNDGSQPVANGFDVSNQVTLILRNIADVGKVLDQAVSAGANQINGINFNLEDSDQALDEARKAAIADAKRKAELYAAASGVSLGNVIAITEAGNNQPQPIFMAKARAESGAADVPVSPGEQVIAADITIIWEIK